MKKILFVACVLVLFFSCSPDPDLIDPDFWAINIADNSRYGIRASLLAEGSYCNVWAENDSGVSEYTARKVANEYDKNIYDKMINAFSMKDFHYKTYTFSNIMEFADWFTNSDGKLCILLLDIKDRYLKGVNDSYVAGYFWAGNFFNGTNSNKCDMIYIDTYPGKPGEEESNMTMAHEMQHLMNFVSTIIYRWDEESQYIDSFLMDTWIDEGLSAAAEWVYVEKQNQDRIDWFNNNGKVFEGKKTAAGLIDKGNNFFVWDNHKENQYAVLDDYATVYLFFQWLRLQGGSGIYKEIIKSEYSDYNAIVKNIGGYNTWDSLLETWLAANCINSSGGKYGYMGELDVKVSYAPTGIQSVELYSGEGVYSFANTQPNTIPGTNIEYRYIFNNSIGGFSSGSTLLTYNTNISAVSAPESGTVTGAAPAAAASMSMAHEGRFAATKSAAPWRVDAGDLLRRNGGNRLSDSGVDLSGFFELKRTAIDK